MAPHPDAGSGGGVDARAVGIYRVYGARLATALPLVTPLPRSDGAPDVRVAAAPAASLAPAFEGEAAFTLREPGDADPPRRLEFRAAGGRGAAVRVSGFADVVVGRDRIRYVLSGPDRTRHLEIFLLGYLLALWLEMRGALALHASAVAVGDGSVGFLAAKEGGKTSLAAALLEVGGALLTDDLVAARPAGGGWRVPAAFPQMRMWPEAVRRFGLDPGALERVHAGTEKRRVPIGDGGLGRFLPSSRPLSALYLPDPVRAPSGEAPAVEIERLRGAEAVAAVLGASFLGRELGALDLEQTRIAAVGELVRSVPVKRLRFPWGWEHLVRARDAVLEDLA